MPGESDMLDAPAAARKAADYLKALIPQAENILLEEVEREENGSALWLITLSFLRAQSDEGQDQLSQDDLSEMSRMETLWKGPLRRRTYKTFAIDAQTGEVKSMKIRTIQ